MRDALTPADAAPSVGQEVRALLALAIPVMVSRIGLLLLVAVDLAMTGQAGTKELAFLSLALAPHVVLSVIGVGMMTGTSIMIAQAVGAGRLETCGAIWRVALLHGALVGTGFALLSLVAEEGFLLARQDPELAAGAGRVVGISLWGLPATYMFIATVMFLEAAGKPSSGAAIMLAANGVNLALNWLLIYGNAGFPALGAQGAVLATTLVRWIGFGLLVIVLVKRLDTTRWGVFGKLPSDLEIGPQLRRYGYPMALTYGLESSAFAVMALFAGLAGALHLAAYQIAMNLVTLVYMLPLGIATATCILVGQAVGRKDGAGLRRSARTGLVFAVAVLLLVGGFAASIPSAIAALYTNDGAVLEIAAWTVTFAALVFLFDGLKEVLAGALRGMGDVWPATIANLVAFWLIMVPLGYLLAIDRGAGAPALLLAVLTGGALATICLLFRLTSLSRRPLEAKLPAP